MALSKADLLEYGVEPATAKLVMEEHGRMQTSYIKRIEELESKVDPDLKDKYEKEKAAWAAEKAQLEAQAKASKEALTQMKRKTKTVSLLADSKPFDTELVTSLIKTDDLDVDSEDFDAKFKERLEAVKQERAYLFEAVVEKKPDDDEGSMKKPDVKPGFIRAEAGAGAPSAKKGYTRTPQGTLPNISDVFNFDSVKE